MQSALFRANIKPPVELVVANLDRMEAEQMKVDVMDIFTDESAVKEFTEAELAEREQRHEDYMLSLYLG